MAQISKINFSGNLEASKSLMNRALIVQSFYPEFDIKGFSQCNDVVAMEKALVALKNGKEMDCGSGGTTFRFLLARISRLKGSYRIKASARLLSRPHQPLFEALKSLGVSCQLKDQNDIEIKSDGWKINGPLELGMDYSSQFLSAILLSSWGLPEELVINLSENRSSYSYLQMTMRLLQSLGMEVQEDKNQIRVPAGQKLKVFSWLVEPDMSSAFALVAHGLIAGKVEIQNFPEKSLQPDFYFLKILESLKASFDWNREKGSLKIHKSENLRPVMISLENYPDLFPVLAVLLSRVEGESRLSGLKLLGYKESHRLNQMAAFLTRLGFFTEIINDDEFVIHGKIRHDYPETFSFDPDQDHRLYMAAHLASTQGASLELLNPEVVNKSFPQFLSLVTQ